MKIIKILSVSALAIALVSCGTGSAPKNPGFEVEAEYPQQSLIDSVSYYIGFNFGFFIKNNGFDENVVNMNKIKEGMRDYFKASSPNDTSAFKLNPQDMNKTFSYYIGKMNAYNNEINLKKGEAFLEANKEKEGVETTESGLQYRILAEGSEVRPTSTKDTVEVRYVGTFIDGSEFDSSKDETVSMPLSIFIEGWKEGLQKIGEGGEIELYIPANLAYGPTRRGMIPGNSTLIFNVELIKVSPYDEEASKNKISKGKELQKATVPVKPAKK